MYIYIYILYIYIYMYIHIYNLFIDKALAVALECGMVALPLIAVRLLPCISFRCGVRVVHLGRSTCHAKSGRRY